MRKWMTRAAAMMALTSGLLQTGRAEATFTITFAQVGSDVVATGVGTINFTGLKLDSSDFFSSDVNSSLGSVILGPTSVSTKDAYQASFANREGFGTATNYSSPSSGTGFGAGLSARYNFLYVPFDYVSGAPLTDSNTYANQTFASLALTAGTYTYSYAVNGGTDSFVIVIPAGVPEPASFVMLGSGLAGACGVVRMRRRV